MDYETVWLRVEAMVLRLMEEHGETRNSIGPRLGLDRNYLRRYLLTEDQRQSGAPVKPAFDLAFQIADFFGVQPTSLLAPFASDAPEALLMLFPSEREKQIDGPMLDAIKALEERVVATKTVWGSRTGGQRATIHADLRELEQRRDYEPKSVAETCRAELIRSAGSSGPLGHPRSLRLVGLVGIWGSVQRRKNRLFQSWTALRAGLPLARRLGDQTLYANLLQRSAYYFHSVEARAISIALLREASEYYRADGNDTGAACTLVDRAVMVANDNQIEHAENLYRAGLGLLPVGSNPVYRVWAAQGLATCRDLQGDLEGALHYLNQAAKEGRSENRRLFASLLFTAANLERRLCRFKDAESKYWFALETFKDFQDADSILRVCLDLSVCLIQSGRRTNLEAVRAAVREQLPKLRNCRVIQHHCELLLRELSNDEVGLQQLAKVAEVIEVARPSL